MDEVKQLLTFGRERNYRPCTSGGQRRRVTLARGFIGGDVHVSVHVGFVNSLDFGGDFNVSLVHLLEFRGDVHVSSVHSLDLRRRRLA